jgi:hypothetical protein
VLARPRDFAGDDGTTGRALSIIINHERRMLHRTSADMIEVD